MLNGIWHCQLLNKIVNWHLTLLIVKKIVNWHLTLLIVKKIVKRHLTSIVKKYVEALCPYPVLNAFVFIFLSSFIMTEASITIDLNCFVTGMQNRNFVAKWFAEAHYSFLSCIYTVYRSVSHLTFLTGAWTTDMDILGSFWWNKLNFCPKNSTSHSTWGGIYPVDVSILFHEASQGNHDWYHMVWGHCNPAVW